MVLMDVLLAAARLGAPTHPEALIASVEHPSPAPGGVTRGSRLFPGDAFGCRGRVVQSGPSGMKAPGRPGTVSSPGNPACGLASDQGPVGFVRVVRRLVEGEAGGGGGLG